MYLWEITTGNMPVFYVRAQTVRRAFDMALMIVKVADLQSVNRVSADDLNVY